MCGLLTRALNLVLAAAPQQLCLRGDGSQAQEKRSTWIAAVAGTSSQEWCCGVRGPCNEGLIEALGRRRGRLGGAGSRT